MSSRYYPQAVLPEVEAKLTPCRAGHGAQVKLGEAALEKMVVWPERWLGGGEENEGRIKNGRVYRIACKKFTA